MMTVAAAFMGLLPIMWSTSAGADVMKRIAAPMIGGLVTSFLLELLVYPAIYKLWKRRELEATPPPGPRCRPPRQRRDSGNRSGRAPACRTRTAPTGATTEEEIRQ